MGNDSADQFLRWRLHRRGVTREVNKVRIPSDKILCQNGIIGYMTSFAARDGLDVIDEKAVKKCWTVNKILDDVRGYNYNALCSQTGTFDGHGKGAENV
ncbi:MAG: hypothetical protein HYV59_12215 [Planctomycetes bacterium]|nr:hypothetical protein [Planctomycetota bacterium]